MTFLNWLTGKCGWGKFQSVDINLSDFGFGKEPAPTLDDKKVLNAFMDPKWDYRTIRGIAKETGLTAPQVRSTINKYKFIVQAPFTSATDEPLFYLDRSKSAFRVFWDFFRHNR